MWFDLYCFRVSKHSWTTIFLFKGVTNTICTSWCNGSQSKSVYKMTTNQIPVCSITRAENRLSILHWWRETGFVWPSQAVFIVCQYRIHRLYDETTSTLYGDNVSGLTEQQIHRVAAASKVLQRPLEAQSWPLLGGFLLLWLMCEALPLQE